MTLPTIANTQQTFTMKTYREFFTALDNTNWVDIDQEVYQHCMEVLPPIDLGTWWFTMQEGDGDRILFEDHGAEGKRAGLLRKQVVNHESGKTFMIRLVRNSPDHDFLVKDAYVCEFNPPKSLEKYLGTFTGETCKSIHEIENTIVKQFKELLA